jgi:hypothetical protein
MSNPLSMRPWLLVVAVFLVLIAAWITVIQLSGRIVTKRLTPAEEAQILQRGATP